MLKKQYVKSRHSYKVTFEIPQEELPEDVEVEAVYLVGEFNDWDETATPMKHDKKNKVFRVTLELEPDRDYQFRYLVNGTHWCNAWAADAYIPNDFGEDNCVVSTSEASGPNEEAGDVIIDGGNSNYKETMRRAAALREKDIHFVDVGTSGGVWGLAEGYSMMVGGAKEAVEIIRPALETLAPDARLGWGHVGPSGSGHFVKMVHNGIEYGLMQAYAEGFELMQHKTEFNLNLHQIAEVWRYGSVVRSWLLDLTANALAENPTLEGIAAYVPDSGEGRWTVVEAIELRCSIPVITIALQRRFRSREAAPFSDKLLAAMRNQFGGHAVKRT